LPGCLFLTLALLLLELALLARLVFLFFALFLF